MVEHKHTQRVQLTNSVRTAKNTIASTGKARKLSPYEITRLEHKHSALSTKPIPPLFVGDDVTRLKDAVREREAFVNTAHGLLSLKYYTGKGLGGEPCEKIYFEQIDIKLPAGHKEIERIMNATESV